jgi:hypothetical protein
MLNNLRREGTLGTFMSFIRVFRAGFTVGRSDIAVFWWNWKLWLTTWILRIVTSAATWILLGG